MDPRALFRKAALDRFAAPERLDVPVRIIPAAEWLALLTVGFTLLAIVLWSICGSMPEQIDGQGLLIRGGELRSISVSGGGQLSQLNVRLNDIVSKGQLIGLIEQADVADRAHVAQQRYEDAQVEVRKANAAELETIQGYQATIQGYDQDIQRTEAVLRSQKDSLARLEGLLRIGAVKQSSVDQAMMAMNDSESKIDSLRSSSRLASAQIRNVNERIRVRQQQVTIARQTYESETRRFSAVSNITAAVEGRVVELKKKTGDRVADGEILAVVEPSSTVLEPVVFVAAGRRIQPPMEVHVYPSTVKRDEFGFMKGTVKAVKDFPATPESIDSVVNNSQLVKEFLSSGSKREVRIALEPDADTPSGYAWSSGEGPPFRVDGGTTVNVSIVVTRHRPISKVWPTLKTIVGAP